MSRLLLCGATSLVGQEVLRMALHDAAITRVLAPTRRPLPTHPKLENPVVDFEQLPADAAWWQADVAICTLGTTLRDASSPAAFRRVDLDYVLAFARLARAGGARAFALTSSLGAMWLRGAGRAGAGARWHACAAGAGTVPAATLSDGARGTHCTVAAAFGIGNGAWMPGDLPGTVAVAGGHCR